MKKIIVDILLFILMLLEFSRVYLSSQIHEIIGIILIILIILHLFLNRKYFSRISKGKYNLKRSIALIINFGFLIVFTLTSIFGALSSQDMLAFLNIGNLTIVYLHKIFAYLCLIFAGFHLGVNIPNLFEKNKFIYIVYGVIVILGIYSFIQVDFYNHLIGYYGFSTPTTGLFTNFFEYLAIVLMITILANLIFKKLI